MKIKKTVAALFALAAVFFVLFLCFFGTAEAFSVRGLKDWAIPLASKSLNAVLAEIPQSTPAEERDKMLSLVAEQIFRGYEVSIKNNGGLPQFIFNITGDAKNWEIEIVPPHLREPVSAWFADDINGIEHEILSLLENFPIEALAWADSELKSQIASTVEKRISGWSFSILVRLSGDKKILQISFSPKQPFVLSITTSVKSNALPVMFQTDLSAKLVADMSGVIGIPVDWARAHEEKITQLAVQKLEDRNAVFNIRASVSAQFKTDQISKLDARTDSERFFFALRLAAYAGSRGRVPELWLTAGWKTIGFTKLPIDIYNETFVALDEFKVWTRLGARFEFMKNFMLGAEYASKNDAIWYRFWWDSAKKPYFWWRWNVDAGHNFAFGYRLRDDIAVELHYDDGDRDRFSLRGILQF